MKPTPTYRASTYSTAAASSYATDTTYTPAARSLAVVFVATSLASGPSDPSAVDGHGVSFAKQPLGTSALGTTHRISLWVANVGTSPTSAAVTATFASGNQTGCSIIEFEITDVDLSGGAAAVIVQRVTNSGTGTTGTVTMPAQGNPDNIELAFFVHLANEGTTPRTNWTEPVGADGNYTSPDTGAAAQYRTDAYETTASATWATSAAWLGVGLEIKAALVVAAVGVLSLVGLTPALGFAMLVGSGALGLSGPAPTTLQTGLVPTGTLTLAGQAPAHQFGGAGTGSLVFAGVAPTPIIRAITILPGAGSLTLAGTTPTVAGSGIRSPGVGALTLSGQQPAALTMGQIAALPGKGSLVFTGYAPAHKFLGAGEASLALAGVAPTISVSSTANTNRAPGTGSLLFASDDIEVQFLGPDAGTLTLNGVAPTASLVLGTIRTPGTGMLALAGQTPIRSVFGPVNPATGLLAFAGTTPTLAIVPTGLVPSGALTLTGQLPSVALFGPTTIGTGSLVLSGTTPALAFSRTMFPPTGALTIAGTAPALRRDQKMTPAAGTLVLAGTLPAYVFAGLAQPGTGTLTLTGYPPALVPMILGIQTGTLTLSGQEPIVLGLVTAPITTFTTWTTDAGFTSWVTLTTDTFRTWGAG